MAPVEDRIFVGARKHFRARYSRTEVAVGAALILCLGAIAQWIRWKGEHADPELSASAPLIRREPPTERGPIPANIAGSGWKEERVAQYDKENVYVKIDGREGYYKNFGFQRLHTMTLTAPGGDPVIDLEVYDLGRGQNALGASIGEMPPGKTPLIADDTVSLVDRNALYLARGKYYLRAMASAETPAVRAELEGVRDRFIPAVPATPIPIFYAAFAAFGVPPSKVQLEAQNALSFGFATDVYEAPLDEDTQLFLSQRADAKAAQQMAAQFAKGFSDYGTEAGNLEGVRWFKDRYLQRVSGAGSTGNMVVGVYRAADEKAGAALYRKLVTAAGGKP